MADQSIVELRAELAATKAALAAEQERSAVLLEDAASATGMPADSQGDAPAPSRETPIFVTPARRIDKFKGQPGDATVYEWVADTRGVLATLNLPKRSQAAYVIENLSGRARQEIIGRGEETCKDPDAIFQVLLRVFGDGDSLPQIQQRFYSYRQGTHEDLVSCSLTLLSLYDRIVQWDPTFRLSREKAMKERLAEAVQDEGLRRELRRLNVESPDLRYFHFRDRALQWMGRTTTSQTRRDLTQQEMQLSETTDLHKVVAEQEKQLKALQAQLHTLSLSQRQPPPRQRLCWSCQSPEHLQRHCPRNNGARPPFDSRPRRPLN